MERLVATICLLSIFSSVSHAIFDGKPVEPGSTIAKTSVAIHTKSVTGKHAYCTGVVLSPTLVLTAAHCVSSNDDSEILLGTLVHRKGDRDPKEGGIQIARVYQHPLYKTFKDDDIQEKTRVDIAIVRLASALPEAYKAAELQLDKASFDKKITLSGFGVQTASGGRRNLLDPNSQAENVELRTIAARIDQADNEIFKIDQHRGGVCSGDSGGGMYDPQALEQGRAVVIAINSLAGEASGPTCANVAFGLRLIAHKAWIRQTLQSLGVSF